MVSATNAVGTGRQLGGSNAVTPTNLAAPGPPTGVTAVAGNGSATVTWTAPASNGGSPITSYSVTPSLTGSEGGSAAAADHRQRPPTATLICGLTNGATYTFTRGRDQLRRDRRPRPVQRGHSLPRSPLRPTGVSRPRPATPRPR